MRASDFFPESVNWRALVAKYQKAKTGSSIWQYVSTFFLFLSSWVLMYLSLDVSYWITLLLAIPTAGFVVRLFIFQHDCGHGSFFKKREANDWAGRVCSIFTFTPYKYWKQSHNIHHAGSGNLDERGIGDIYTMTVEEYMKSSKWERFKYRLYRNPVVLFGIVPTLLFLVLYRFPIARSKSLAPTYPSIYWLNLFILIFYGTLGYFVGYLNLLLIQLPITMIASTSGIWLFYVQHQFEDAYWSKDESWDFSLAGIKGSSYFRLPKVLQWFTGNIGFHHIHHLSPKIPNYLLEKCHKENPFFQNAYMITLKTSFKSMMLTLWDEKEKKLVSFRNIRSIMRGDRHFA
ncbi:MAG: hypothetical protein AMXMBFR48_06070 [Ignavibacteriales bacterium]